MFRQQASSILKVVHRDEGDNGTSALVVHRDEGDNGTSALVVHRDEGITGHQH